MNEAMVAGEPDWRVLPTREIHNFRDYGGYRARAGMLRQGVLWRSGQHGHATEGDLAIVQRLGITTVIDLRGDSERSVKPCLRHPDFGADVLFHPGETATVKGRAVHEEFGYAVRSVDEARSVMLKLYESLPFRNVLVGSIRLYIEALSQRRAPSLLHCVAGKDRTGLAAALLHTVMGVHRDDVVADFLLTNTAGDSEARIAAGALHLQSGFGRTMDDAAIRVVMGVEAEFLDRAFSVMAERHGSVAAYARDALGVTPQVLDAMERHLIES